MLGQPAGMGLGRLASSSEPLPLTPWGTAAIFISPVLWPRREQMIHASLIVALQSGLGPGPTGLGAGLPVVPRPSGVEALPPVGPFLSVQPACFRNALSSQVEHVGATFLPSLSPALQPSVPLQLDGWGWRVLRSARPSSLGPTVSVLTAVGTGLSTGSLQSS